MQGKSNAKTLYIKEIRNIYCGGKSHKYTFVFVVLISWPKIWDRICPREDTIVLSCRFREFPPLMEMRFMVMTVHRTRTRKQRVQPESSLAITFKSLSLMTFKIIAQSVE